VNGRDAELLEVLLKQRPPFVASRISPAASSHRRRGVTWRLRCSTSSSAGRSSPARWSGRWILEAERDGEGGDEQVGGLIAA